MNRIDLKERIALSDSFTKEERDFLLTAINLMPEPGAIYDPPSHLEHIACLWAVLAVGEHGEGLCAAPLGGMTMPLVAADMARLEQYRPITRAMARAAKKTIRIAKFTTREDVDIFRG